MANAAVLSPEALQALFVALVLAASWSPLPALLPHLLHAALRACDGRSGARASHAAGRVHSRLWWEKDVQHMSDSDFSRTSRVPRVIFLALVAAASLCSLFTGARALPVDMQVAIGLYKLARPISFFDLAQKFGVSTGAAHHAVTRFVQFLIDRYGQEQLFDRWPTTLAKCVEYAVAMGARTGDPMRFMQNCIGALDGTLIPMWCREAMQRLYQCRKGFHAISHQVVVSGTGFIIWIGGARPGSTWDGNAIKNDTLERLLCLLPAGFFLLADSGYVGTARLLTPFKRGKGQILSAAYEHWNYLHSLCRGLIEKTFGIFKAKWRWALRGIPLSSPEVYADYFFASCILFNMVHEHNLTLSQAAGVAASHEESNAWRTIADEDEDDTDMISYLKNKHAKFAAIIESYVKSIADSAFNFLNPGAGNAVEVAVEEGAADGEEPVVIPDAEAGKKLRFHVYDQMKMDSWVPAKRDRLHAAFRQRRATSRGRNASSRKEDN